ncbi:MAG TPA: ABC transporter permease [Thermoanaerobaculales bacterium]|nr:ABC transporter permease [Thermoanaerobaculales bacterium]HPA80351.1 ABC transporter permease [Thermoanaerobaculales bacterium]HQL29042.1 ABC transporter permease [Thermoanaerobaculales bacterium]HQN97034.1 ABC transporter permease [Thermoanaerobaculales bacterium]HQP42022.1 ABC transporter permease [Thermoanaerobaculales bacterium]
MSRAALTLARLDLRQTLADRSAVMWMFIMPVVFATFFGMVMGGGSDPTTAQVKLTVVDEDRGELARMLIDDLAGARLAIAEIPPEAAGSTPDKTRTLVIPKGFTERVLAGDQVTLVLERDPGSNSEASLAAQARIAGAIARLIGRLVEAQAASETEGPAELGAVLATAGAVDVVTVESRYAGKARVAPGGFAHSVPGNTVMFVMLVALTYGAGSVSAERMSGMLRRIATSPVSKADIILGKIIGRMAVAAVQVTVLVLVCLLGARFFGEGLGGRPLAVWAILILFGATVAPLGVAVGGFIRDPDRAANVGVMATLGMAALGGCWWPIEVVSPALQKVALLFPTGWAMRALHGVISFGEGLQGVAVPLAALALYGLAFTAAAARLLRAD